MQQLRTIDPLRKPHRDSMCSEIDAVRTGWNELEKRLVELLMDFKNEAFTLLGSMKLQCVEAVGVYHQHESNCLSSDEYRAERIKLIATFRHHFTQYDLSEAAIFDRFNKEVNATVGEMR